MANGKKIFWFYFLWTSGSIAVTFISYRFFFFYFWQSLAGLIFFSFLLLIPSSALLDLLLKKYRLVGGRRFFIFLFLLAALFFIVYAAHSVIKHLNFNTGYDLAIFDQAIWHLSRFELPQSSIRNIPNLFGDHFHPIIAFLAPFYWIFPNPIVLLFLQSLLLVSPVIILYFWAKEWKIKRIHLFIVSFFYLISVPVQAVVNFDFHEIVFAPLFLIGAFYFLAKKRWLFYFLFIILLLFTKEELAILVGMVGLFIIFKERLHVVGLATLGLGLGSFFVITGLIMPNLGGGASYQYLQFYPGFENGITGGIMHYLSHPSQLIDTLSRFPEKWWLIGVLLWQIFIPLAFMPQAFFLFLFPVAQKVFTSYSFLFAANTQYNLVFSALAAITLFYFLKEWEKHKFLLGLQQKIVHWKLSLPTLIVIFPMIFNLIYTQQFSYLFKIPSNWFFLKEVAPKADIEELMDFIPPTISVSASAGILPHLSERRKIYMFPAIKDAEFLIFQYCFDENCILGPAVNAQTMQGISQYLKNNTNFKLLKENLNGAVFERVGVYDKNLQGELFLICESLIKNTALGPILTLLFLHNCRE